MLVLAASARNPDDGGHADRRRRVPRHAVAGRHGPHRGVLHRPAPRPRAVRDRAGRVQRRPVARLERPAPRPGPGRERVPRSDRHAPRGRRPGHRRGAARRAARRLAARRRRALTSGRLCLHGGLPARQGGPARRPPGDDPLGLLRRPAPQPPRGDGRAGPDLRPRYPSGHRRRRLHLGRRDGGNRSRPGAGRGGRRARSRAGGRSPARRVRPAPRRPGAVQRAARPPRGHSAHAARASGVAARSPRRGPRPSRRWPNGRS